jgi:AcrR family transcriptional regulator
MNMETGKGTRPYRMQGRAASTEATRQRIIAAAMELSLEHWYDEITLKQIAAAAGVALQTVVNHFGTKDGIMTAVLEQPVRAEMMTRAAAKPDEIEGAVRLLVADYERTGNMIVRGIALEERIPALQPTLDRGREEHRKWVQRTFPAALFGRRGAARERRLDLLVCATDVFTWKLLRRDRGLGQAQTMAAIRELVEALHR